MANDFKITSTLCCRKCLNAKDTSMLELTIIVESVNKIDHFDVSMNA